MVDEEGIAMVGGGGLEARGVVEVVMLSAADGGVTQRGLGITHRAALLELKSRPGNSCCT